MPMTKTPEQEARETIDKMLEDSGWDVQDVEKANIHAKNVGIPSSRAKCGDLACQQTVALPRLPRRCAPPPAREQAS